MSLLLFATLADPGLAGGRRLLETGLVPRLPTAVLAIGTMILAAVSFVAGLILDTVTLSRREIKRLHYLGPARADVSRTAPVG